MTHDVTGSHRVIQVDTFDGSGYTNENSLHRARLTAPEQVNSSITWMQGNPNNRFPLTFLTEGQEGGSDGINDIEYYWNTAGSLTKPSTIISSPYSAGDKPGIGGSPIILVMEDNWIKVQHSIRTTDGRTLRADTRGKPVSTGGYEYEFQLIRNTADDYLDPSDIAQGRKLSMVGLPKVSESFSMGNESNKVFPGQIKNQISISRKSRRIGGNIKNKIVEVTLKAGNTLTRFWEPYEEWQFEMEVKQMAEEDYWFSEYNRLPDGTITTIDKDNDLPIPSGAGIEYQIPNRDTYSKLTVNRLKRTVSQVFRAATDQDNMIVTLFTGEGGFEEFDNAIKQEAGGWANLLTGAAATQFVKESAGGLSFGNYFNVYKHVDGHLIILKKLALLDKSGITENAPLHPVTLRPVTSYDMYFIDQSTYDGVNNIQMVYQKGRQYIRGILKGMAPAPDHFKWTGNDIIATERDESSLHLLMTKGIRINRNTHCFKLEFDRSVGI